VFVCTDFASDGRPLDVPPLERAAAAHPDELATLTWDGLRSLAERGVEIGSHTRTHPNLRTLSDDELRDELRTSREEIEDELGRPCTSLAYPYGQFDERVRRATERAGYESAFGIVGVGPLGGRFGIPRVDPGRDDGELALRLKGSRAWPVLSPALRRLRGAVGRLT